MTIKTTKQIRMGFMNKSLEESQKWVSLDEMPLIELDWLLNTIIFTAYFDNTTKEKQDRILMLRKYIMELHSQDSGVSQDSQDSQGSDKSFQKDNSTPSLEKLESNPSQDFNIKCTQPLYIVCTRCKNGVYTNEKVYSKEYHLRYEVNICPNCKDIDETFCTICRDRYGKHQKDKNGKYLTKVWNTGVCAGSFLSPIHALEGNDKDEK